MSHLDVASDLTDMESELFSLMTSTLTASSSTTSEEDWGEEGRQSLGSLEAVERLGREEEEEEEEAVSTIVASEQISDQCQVDDEVLLTSYGRNYIDILQSPSH